MSATIQHETTDGLWSPRFAPVTLGLVALVALTAFEALAVATAMPTVSDALDGTSLYALAFGAPLASGVFGMVLGGRWSDRRGPLPPLRAGVQLFVVGLAVAGLAPTMPVLVAGRLLQGVGSGALTVALYVAVARVYPERLHPKVFAAFSGAWVVPGLVGPSLAGLAVDRLGWRWVFLAVVPPALLALAAVSRTLRDAAGEGDAGDAPGRPAGALGWAASAAVAAAVLADAGRRGGLAGAVEIAVSVTVLVVCVPRLLPAGTWRGRPGLPAVVALRGAIGGAFLVAEVFLPLLLDRERGFSASSAGVALTIGSLSWFAGSWVQGRPGLPLSLRARLQLGAALVVVGVAGVATLTSRATPVLVGLAAWTIGGFGIGLVFPTLSVLTLRLSAPEDAGANSSALQLNDSLTTATGLAVAGTAFAALERSSVDAAPAGGAAFLGVFTVAAVLGVVAVWLAPRACAHVLSRPR